MTNLFKGELGQGLSFLGDLAAAGLSAEDVAWLRENARAAKEGGTQSILADMVELVHHARSRASLLWERISDTSIRVNLAAVPKPLFQCATVEWNEGSGWVTVDRKGDDLYVNDRKVELFLMEGQKMGGVKGHGLRKQIDLSRALHPNILDALLENVHLIPKSWKFDEHGWTRAIFFWGTIYRGSDGNLYVRCLYWSDVQWDWNYSWLDHIFGGLSPAAISAS